MINLCGFSPLPEAAVIPFVGSVPEDDAFCLTLIKTANPDYIVGQAVTEGNTYIIILPRSRPGE